MRRIDRLDQYLEYKGITDYRLTIDAGLSQGTIGKSREPNRDISNKTVEKIMEVCSDLNKAWLLSGEGEMLKTTSAVAENHSISIAGEEIKENRINVNTDETIDRLILEIAAQRRVTEKVLEQNSELIAIIANRKA